MCSKRVIIVCRPKFVTQNDNPSAVDMYLIWLLLLRLTHVRGQGSPGMVTISVKFCNGGQLMARVQNGVNFDRLSRVHERYRQMTDRLCDGIYV